MTGSRAALAAAESPPADRALPSTRLLASGRPPAQWLLRHWWRVEVRGDAHVPTQGPLVMAANHIGWLDGPLLAICSPRPVHALTKQEMFAGPVGPLLRASGQIPLDRQACDLGAIRAAVRALEYGLAVGVFPEGARGPGEMTSPRSGAAYLALVTGAPVVPVAFLGTRVRGGSSGSLPPRGSRLTMTFGPPVRLGQQPWPRTQQQVAAAAAEVTAGIRSTLREAEQQTGLTLPGPLGPRPEKKK